jgi:hypothetical protein
MKKRGILAGVSGINLRIISRLVVVNSGKISVSSPIEQV